MIQWFEKFKSFIFLKKIISIQIEFSINCFYIKIIKTKTMFFDILTQHNNIKRISLSLDDKENLNSFVQMTNIYYFLICNMYLHRNF